jgi:hypothetical protein
MLWTSFAAAAMGNVVLRDAKFSLPLLIVAACCAAVQQKARVWALAPISSR